MILSMLIYAFVSSFTPGPNNIMAMVFTNKYGVKQTFRFCLGVGIGFLVILCLSCFFNIILYQVMPKIGTGHGVHRSCIHDLFSGQNHEK